jgi:enoyl-[acyl-carrier-protein] reductase (NADH)
VGKELPSGDVADRPARIQRHGCGARRAAADEATMLWTKERQPLPSGMLHPTDLANAALYFLSDESRHVTGQVHAVDGGFGVT